MGASDKTNMALKFRLKSKDEVPAEVQHLYIERDGAWVLDIDGATDKAKLEESRANNIAVTRERICGVSQRQFNGRLTVEFRLRRPVASGKTISRCFRPIRGVGA